MRSALLVLAGLGALAACTPTAEQNQVSATPPTPPSVSYRVVGTDVTQANASAAAYCQRYGTGPVYRGSQTTPTGNVATYTCDGPPVAVSGSSVAPTPQQCADVFHQNLPGGSDYEGPRDARCPPTY
ncbi:MAG TPA: hypothetical protein VLV50_17555 [Stellaceae bacterium]|nr:hypothetical protein [Stellaceae bacterium]